MRFRLRVLGWVTLVVAIATGATAWLTLTITTAQVADATVASERDIETIISTLAGYGQAQGTWQGVPATVENLSQTTGQRIRLVTEVGEVIVDSDTIAGRTARTPKAPTYWVNPRPVLEIAEQDLKLAIKITTTAITNYRIDVRRAACLTAAEVTMSVNGLFNGIPRLLPAERQLRLTDPVRFRSVLNDCNAFAIQTSEGQRAADMAAAQTCDGSVDRLACLRVAFADRTASDAPVPLQLQLGAVNEPQAPAGPILAAAALVAVLAIAATMLLSHRVLRPVTLITHATRQLALGQLDRRVPLVGNDELTAMAHSFNQMADSLQRAEERQRRLIADVAHELRTPLANLRGYLEALKDGVIAADPAIFASLHDEAVLQQRIVDDLQELALAEAGVLAYQRHRIDLGELLETCRVAHIAIAEPAGIRLVIDCPTPIYLEADPDRIRQVIGNLLSNACKHSPPGGTVTLRAVASTSHAVIEVADTGTGIAEADLPHIFDRFWRSDTARSRRTGGSGLGLAIARQLVLDHGGTVGAVSQIGAGTTVTITLPY
ncbi:two-component sensor histidine kinase [Rhizocola hellebori]|uniref:histidine kinase n=1 Tax=Rhizocola hellebori TaxID=1392758 RepID=A0A8J3Q6H3_9ACTN|nr:ATP-binding protein [Rhizocola hellebori]GIH04040.1 two-component sensor histidine kinase [Rhizocola hellebori]